MRLTYYSEEDQRKLLCAIRKFLELDTEIKIINKRKGSVILSFNLPTLKAKELLDEINKGGFSDFNITGAKLIPTDLSASTSYETVKLDNEINDIITKGKPNFSSERTLTLENTKSLRLFQKVCQSPNLGKCYDTQEKKKKNFSQRI